MPKTRVECFLTRSVVVVLIVHTWNYVQNVEFIIHFLCIRLLFLNV